MGVCIAKELRDQANADNEIDKQLKKEQLEQFRHIKLLLLGPGESGKSTILKQMQILHKNGFSAAQMQEFKELIYSNTIQCMAVLVAALETNQQNISCYDNAHFQDDCELVKNCAASGEDRHAFSQELYLALRRLWGNEGIRECYEDRHILHLPDCAKHFFDSLERTNESDFEPSYEDILFTRVSTTGVVEVSFNVKDNGFHVFDVGGQRSERRKWMHIFDNVNGVIFITAISDYNLTMREDENMNRLMDSLQPFASVCNSEFFLQTTFILFLNKKDLFAAKIQTVPITVAFPEFAGDHDYLSSLEYVKGKYRALNVNTANSMIIHETCATDTSQVENIINDVIDTVIAQNMSLTGM